MNPNTNEGNGQITTYPYNVHIVYMVQAKKDADIFLANPVKYCNTAHIQDIWKN